MWAPIIIFASAMSYVDARGLHAQGMLRASSDTNSQVKIFDLASLANGDSALYNKAVFHDEAHTRTFTVLNTCKLG
jgi:hypothetical protein